MRAQIKHKVLHTGLHPSTLHLIDDFWKHGYLGWILLSSNELPIYDCAQSEFLKQHRHCFLLKTAPSLKHTQLDSQLSNCAVTVECEGKGFLWSTASCQHIVINWRKWLEQRQLQNLGLCIRAKHQQVELAGLPISSWKQTEVNPCKQHKTKPKSTKSKEQSQEALSDFPLLVELCWIQIFCSSVSSRDVVWSARLAGTDSTGHCTTDKYTLFYCELKCSNSNYAVNFLTNVKDGTRNHFLIWERGMCRGGKETI